MQRTGVTGKPGKTEFFFKKKENKEEKVSCILHAPSSGCTVPSIV